MNAKLAQRSQRVVLEIGAAAVVAWFIMFSPLDRVSLCLVCLFNLSVMLENKYFSNITFWFGRDVFVMIYSFNIPKANEVVLSICFYLIFSDGSIGGIDLKS